MTMTTTTATWPTIDELAEVERAFFEAGHMLDVLHLRVSALERPLIEEVGGADLPTLAELGALSRFVAKLELELGSVRRNLESVIEGRDTAAQLMPTRPPEGERDAS